MTGEISANNQSRISIRVLLVKIFVSAIAIFVVLFASEWVHQKIIVNGKIDPATLTIDEDTYGNILDAVDQVGFLKILKFEKLIEGLLVQESVKKSIFGADGVELSKDERNKAFTYNVYRIQLPKLKTCFRNDVETLNSGYFHIDSCHNIHGFFGGSSVIDGKNYQKYLDLTKKLIWLADQGLTPKSLRDVLIRLKKIVNRLPVIEEGYADTTTLASAEVASISIVRADIISEIEHIRDSRDWDIFESKPDWASTIWHCFYVAFGPALFLTVLQIITLVGHREAYNSFVVSSSAS